MEFRLDHDSKANWKKSLSFHSKPFVWNWDNLPVNVLFTIFILAAPVLVTLPSTNDRPVLQLTFSGAVCPLLTFGTLLD